MPFIIRKLVKSVFNSIRFIKTKRNIRNRLNKGEEFKLEVGAGNRPGSNGWLSLDITKKCDLFWDLRNGIPFPNASVSAIYSSHFLEHLTFEEGEAFLAECLRVLKTEGVFSICVPNAKIYLDAYTNNERLDEEVFLSYRAAYNNTTLIDQVNYIAYMCGEHKYLFDEENLLFRLTSSGFKSAKLRCFDRELDMESRHPQSIYALAIR